MTSSQCSDTKRLPVQKLKNVLQLDAPSSSQGDDYPFLLD
jgi:hypothetical protein